MKIREKYGEYGENSIKTLTIHTEQNQMTEKEGNGEKVLIALSRSGIQRVSRETWQTQEACFSPGEPFSESRQGTCQTLLAQHDNAKPRMTFPQPTLQQILCLQLRGGIIQCVITLSS